MKKIKRVLAFTLVMVMCSLTVGCGNTPKVEKETTTEAPAKVTQTDHINVEGIYVDSSYVDEDNAALKRVYLFYTVSTEDQNISLSSIGMSMKIGDTNTYSAANYPNSCTYMNSYYYSSYIEDVYVGSSLKMVSTFEIPEGDLVAGKDIKLANYDIPDIDDIKLSTDDIIACENVEAIAETADPEGYSAELEKRKEADDATVNKVKAEINGYYWSFYVNSTAYEIEFWEENNFEVRALGNGNQGTYTITNGYIMCEYTNTGYVVEIPYCFEDGEFKLDATTAFDVY